MRIMNPNARITYRFEPAKAGGSGKLVRIGPEGDRRNPDIGRNPDVRRNGDVRRGPEAGPDGHGFAADPDWQDEFRFERDVIPWKSPFQDDTDALERLIREADGQIVAKECESGEARGEGPEQPAAGAGPDIRAEKRRSEAAVPERKAEAETMPDAGTEPEAAKSGPDTAPAGDSRFRASVAGAGVGALQPAGEPPAGGEGVMPDFRIVPRRRPSAPSWARAVATVIGAVLTGGLFGWLVMSLLFWQMDSPDPDAAGGRGNAEAVTAVPAGGPAAAPDEAGGSPEFSGGAAPVPVEVELPAVRYHVLQYGVFSGEAGLEEALAQLRAAGYAAAADTADGYRAYAGIAESRDAAEALAAAMDGVELYIRPLDIPAAGRVLFTGRPEEAEAFIRATNDLVRMTGGLSASLLASGGTGPIPQEAWSDWEAAYRVWSEAAAKLPGGDAAGAEARRLADAVGKAAEAFAAYRANPAPDRLRDVQSALIGAAVAQRDWMRASGAL
jgi:hypothetical protein